MSIDIGKCKEVICDAVKHAGETIKAAIGRRDKRIDLKSSEIDLVTETDQAVEKYLIGAILSQFPEHQIIGEESVADGAKVVLTDEPTWIIDPIDGTMNFVHGFPHVCISVGLLVNKKPELAIIFNPVLNQWFQAERGQGATLNGDPIRVSNVTDLSKAVVMYEFGTSREPDRVNTVLANINNIITKVHGVRALGSAALNMAMVALGAADADLEFGIHAWDVAAGWLIVTEAGGVVIDPAGGEMDVLSRRVLCASSQSLADSIVREIQQFYPERD